VQQVVGMTGTARILIAEDHRDSRDALRELLEAFGYEVKVAENGRVAVDMAAAWPPDLILMDIMMPILDGLGATEIIRAKERTHSTPIIAVTAMEGGQERALAAGCTDYVRKPIDMRMLLGKVTSLLGKAVN
jgi:CheY-like chemotaxis protein